MDVVRFVVLLVDSATSGDAESRKNLKAADRGCAYHATTVETQPFMLSRRSK
jgi:hypothetical protein